MPRGSLLKTRNRKRDLDQIYEDRKPENLKRRLEEATADDEDKPALGQYFCLTCDRYFCDESALKAHVKGKPHKRRLKELESEPHTQDVAEWAAGVGPNKRRKSSLEPDSIHRSPPSSDTYLVVD